MWSNQTPYDRCIKSDSEFRTGPWAVGMKSLNVTNVLDASKHPPCYSKVDCTSNQRPYKLESEARTSHPCKNFHVVTKFKIGRKGESMNRTGPIIDFEKQVCNWFSWEDITNYELCNYVISRLLQCNNKYITKSSFYKAKVEARLSKALKQFRKTELSLHLIRSRLNDSYRESKDESETERKQHAPPRQLHVFFPHETHQK